MIRCYVTDRKRGDPISSAEAAIRLGVDYIQVREKDLDSRALYALVCSIRDAAAGTGTQVLVNGRLDIAIAARLDGVHLPGDGLPAARVRPLVRTLGSSVHTVEEALAAERDGVDFVIFGPVFETPGKTPVGLDALRDVTKQVRIPVLAIGGVTEEKIPDVIEAGASGIAAIRMFQL